MSEYARATSLVWESCGRPVPRENTGEVIAPTGDGSAECSMCGLPARYRHEDAYSDNFRPVRQQDRLFPFAGNALCGACTWCAKTLALRCAAWVARPDGLWWIARRDLLANLLDPPEPPFVVCFPLYGIAHGGEAHGHRAVLTGTMHPEPLVRLQSKHVAIYAEIAYSRDRYPLQVDDAVQVTVDVARWRTAHGHALHAATMLRSAGVGVTDTREGLTSLRCPRRAPLAIHAQWPSVVAPLAADARSQWWPVFVDLLNLPEAPPRPEKPARTAHAPVPKARKTPMFSGQQGILL